MHNTIRSCRAGAASVVLLGLTTAISAGCRDHVDRSGQRLGDRHILAGRAAAAGGPEITDDDLRAGYFEAENAALVPLRDELRGSVSLSLQLFGAATTHIPAGDRIVFDSNRNYPGDGRLRLARGATTASIDVPTLLDEYRNLCEVGILGDLVPPGSHGCELFDLSSLQSYIDGLLLELRPADIDVAWVAPRTSIGENASFPVLELRFPFDGDADPKDFIPIDPSFTADIVFRVQVSPNARSGRRAFASYRNRTASVGDVWYSDGGAEFRVRGVAENVVASDFQTQIQRALDRVASRVGNVFDRLLRTVPLDTLNGHLSPTAWQAWCDATFSGSCPVPANVLADMAANSVADLASAEVVLPATVDYPMEASVSPLSADGVWNNPFVTAISRGAELARVMASRDRLASICAPTSTYCDADPTRSGCATCAFCASAPPSLSSVCDFSTELPLVYYPGDGGPRIPRSRNVAALVDLAPNLGLELSRIFNEPVDRWQEAHGTAMSYTNIAWCPAAGADNCPPGATGAVFWLANDPDGDGVPIPDDNCPETPSTDTSDRDGDGIGDLCDACPSTPSASSADLDGDGIPDVCDCDVDGDGCFNADVVPPIDGDHCEANGDVFDERPRTRNDVDLDGDGMIDDCDADDDGDGIPDDTDNCPRTYNPGQTDTNGDGIGDACDRLCPYPGATGCKRFDELQPPEGIWAITPHWEFPPDCIVDGPGCWIFWMRDPSRIDLVGNLVSLASIAAEDLGLKQFDGPVAFIPDADGDGVQDLLIGAPNADRIEINDVEPQAGEIIAVGSVSGKVIWRLAPMDADARFGSSLAVVGHDVWVGAPGALRADNAITGAIVRVGLDGPRGVGVREARFGVRKGQEMGRTLTVMRTAPRIDPKSGARSPGDVVGLVAGGVGPKNYARFDIFDVAGLNPRAVTLTIAAKEAPTVVAVDERFYGKPGFLVGMPDSNNGDGSLSMYTFKGGRAWTISGADGERIGSAISGPVPTSGKWHDVVVGAPGANKGAGAVYLIDRSGALTPVMKGEPGERLGTTLATPGDLDNDGIDDLAIGVPGGRFDPQGIRGGTLVLDLAGWLP